MKEVQCCFAVMLSPLDLMYHSINLQHIAYAGADVYAWMLIHCSASNVSNLKPPGLSKVVHVAADFVACVAIRCPPGGCWSEPRRETFKYWY